nr:putative reverse transcriptase domain-containing protein [Tanacetum cinerariifolium]
MEKIFSRWNFECDIDTLSLRLCLLGLTNAPVVFIDLTNWVCKPYLEKIFIVFIDDILSYSKSKEDHKKNRKYEWRREQEEAFQTLKENLCEASKVENATAEMLRGLDQLMKRKEDGGMYFIWVPLIGDVRTLIMDESHASRYLVHPGVDKTYYDLRDMYGGHIVMEDLLQGFWKILQKALGMRLDMSMAFHHQTDGQSERTIQTMKDMLRAYVINFGGTWDVHLLLARFSYNNSYHSSTQCAEFEALYGRKCRSLEKLKAARDRQKSYVDNKRKLLEFGVEDQVLLKVSPWKGVIRFGKKGKLASKRESQSILVLQCRLRYRINVCSKTGMLSMSDNVEDIIPLKQYILNEKGGPKEDACIMSYQSQWVSVWEGAEVVHLQAGVFK